MKKPRSSDWGFLFRWKNCLAVAVADEFDGGEKKREEACGEAAHGEHQREPAQVCVGTLTGDAAECDEDECGCDDSGAEDEKAGTEELAGVWLHRAMLGAGDSSRVMKDLGLVDQGLHGVDDDSGDGDIKPDGEGVAREFFVRGKTAGE